MKPRTRRWLAAASLTCVVMGCAAPPPPRFDDGPVVMVVEDAEVIARPAENEFHRFAHHVDNFVDRQLRIRLDPARPLPALDVNRWGEVPTSSWYVRRGTLSPAQVEAGAGGADEGPEAHRPWTLTRVKSGGANPGFVFEDARGVGYILKVDKPHVPHIATSAGAIANRLFFALGYRVPDDRLVVFRREDFVLGEKARASGVTEDEVDRVLERRATRMRDGRYRALVSRFLDGVPVGGYSYTGTRDDDANDLVAHERRRSLRALRVFGAWLNHVDLKIDNTLDLHVQRDGRAWLDHYLVDFDGCLGGYWAARGERRIGWAYDLDLGEMVEGLLTLGLPVRPYERLDGPWHPEIGLFEAEVFDPRRWRPNYANDQLAQCGPADRFWAGTVLARITREQIAAAVRVGRFEDPAAAATMESVLWERRAKTLAWALRAVSPVVHLQPSTGPHDALWIEALDALEEAELASALRWRIETRDADGRWNALVTDAATPALRLEAPSLDHSGTCVVRWTAREADEELPPTEAHYRRDARGWRLVGVLRDGQ